MINGKCKTLREGKTSVFLWEPDTYCRFELPSVLNTSVTEMGRSYSKTNIWTSVLRDFSSPEKNVDSNTALEKIIVTARRPSSLKSRDCEILGIL